MTDFNLSNRGRDAGEPARDSRLGAMLRDVVGDPSVIDVNWHDLAGRIAAAVRTPRTAPWWSYVERWQHRALPLAIAAGLIGALAIWGAANSQRAEAVLPTGAADLVSAAAAGASSCDAAPPFARAIAQADGFLGGAGPGCTQAA